jgi:hypothetical protein
MPSAFRISSVWASRCGRAPQTTSFACGMPRRTRLFASSRAHTRTPSRASRSQKARIRSACGAGASTTLSASGTHRLSHTRWWRTQRAPARFQTASSATSRSLAGAARRHAAAGSVACSLCTKTASSSFHQTRSALATLQSRTSKTPESAHGQSGCGNALHHLVVPVFSDQLAPVSKPFGDRLFFFQQTTQVLCELDVIALF